MKRTFPLSIVLVLTAILISSCGEVKLRGRSGVPTAAKPEAKETKDWKEISNALVDEYYTGLGEFRPEDVSAEGFDKFDYQVSVVSEAAEKKQREFVRSWINRLDVLLKEKNLHAELELDYKIMKQALETQLRSQALVEKYGEVSAENYLEFIHFYFERVADTKGDDARAILDSRLEQYVQGVSGSKPLLTSAIDWTRSKIKKYQEAGQILYPRKGKVELLIKNAPTYLEGIKKLFPNPSEKVAGLLARLETQSQLYLQFMSEELLPKTRTAFDEPAELYSSKLVEFGVTVSADDLVKRAEAAYQRLKLEGEKLAQEVAKDRGFAQSDMVFVLRQLQNEKVSDKDELLAHYRKVNEEIEGFIQDNQLVSLPVPYEPLIIEFASEATSKAVPIPHMQPPPLIKNNGERPIFRLPQPLPGMGQVPYAELNCDASSYMLSAHEGRPGHEMQFDSVVKRGVSKVRVIFAMNTANIEGWALYAETIVSPYFTRQAQLAALQSQLMRAARAFLDPKLNMGKINKAEVMRVLVEEVGIAEQTAQVEFERYSSRMPGQATSYFFGLDQIVQLRERAEKELGPKFSEKHFHDELLDNGFLPVSVSGDSIIQKIKELAQ